MIEYIDVTGTVLVDARTGRNRPLAQAQVLPAGQANVPVNLYRRAEDVEAEAFLNLPPDAARALAHALLRAADGAEAGGA